MKRCALVLISLLLVVIGCNSPEQSEWAKQNFSFSIEIVPAFNKSSLIVLKREDSVTYLSFDFLYSSYKLSKSANDDLEYDQEKGWSFIPTDSLPGAKINGITRGDTFYLKEVEDVIISEKALKHFFYDLENLNLATQENLIKEGLLDGITYILRFQSGSVDNLFGLRCPNHTDTVEFQLIKALHNLLDDSFNTDSAISYVEHLESYYYLGLMAKHVSVSPAEFRFYNYLDAFEEKEFIDFKRKFPLDKPILFDLTNFIGMDSIYHPVFRTMIQNNSDIYWLTSEFCKEELISLGVKSDNILKNRKEYFDRIQKGP